MTLDEQNNTRTPLKMALWEEAKGKLRALVAVQGSYFGGRAETIERFVALDAAVTAFITDIEDNGLQE